MESGCKAAKIFDVDRRTARGHTQRCGFTESARDTEHTANLEINVAAVDQKKVGGLFRRRAARNDDATRP